MIDALFRSLAATVLVATLSPTRTAAPSSRPHAHVAAGRAATGPHLFRPRQRGPHTFYGTIVGLQGSNIVLRRRNGTLQNVDASVAIADNAYSQPLFVGKLVTIDGTFTSGVFTAAHIFRLSNLNDLVNDN